jgi:holo-[acyl-carrier protein] synthase
METASGVDLVEIERIQQTINRHGEHFLERVFTPLELEQAGKRPASLAARFAAKEAVAKALGTGIGAVAWREIEILREPSGRPVLSLSGSAAEQAAVQGLEGWSISLSHTTTHAIAFAVALKK